MFAESAALRHIPICSTIVNKPKKLHDAKPVYAPPPQAKAKPAAARAAGAKVSQSFDHHPTSKHIDPPPHRLGSPENILD
eukprot:CAMPEP_0202964296 /NCGR_PEP_ID=MMETSP1396-20130829/8370_1 /ASSEMBLY_ACC=CAM_ASM_000872 /TAXON_ID= /ORGANISM="Pseudokeronopsis sp., Strain Brazil" /LENGTH=79 /DNA_ID=CAMNT_0049686289 /DNA_START=2301 /DNA_END=2540 /DNA_ORIENTATION=+